MCRKGAWAELTVEVTSGSDGSKPDARFEKNTIITGEYIVWTVYSFFDVSQGNAGILSRKLAEKMEKTD